MLLDTAFTLLSRSLPSHGEANNVILAILWPMTVLQFHRLPGYGMGFSLLQSSHES